MFSMRACPLLMLAALLPGCATLVNGSSQNLTIFTSPAGAQCAVDRGGKLLGIVNPTPGSLRIGKSRKNLTVVCAKDGFQSAKASGTSSFGGMTFGNILAGGAAGFVIDAASGANYTYPSEMKLDMKPTARPALASTASVP